MAGYFMDTGANKANGGTNRSGTNRDVHLCTPVPRFGEVQDKRTGVEGAQQAIQEILGGSSPSNQFNGNGDTGNDGDTFHQQEHSRRASRYLGDTNSPTNTTVPPSPPNLSSKHPTGPFGIFNNDQDRREVIKLSIEFPLQQGNRGNDVALFFKRFITVLFAANRHILLEKWIPGEENPISKAIDIAYTEEVISEYYSGMKTLHDKRRIIGFTRILSNEQFSKTKNHLRFRDWLVRNKVWVRPTTLSSSKHVNVGWLL